MQTQSLLFSRADGWTVEKAKEWARQHGHKTSKVDVTDQYVRLRQLDPKGFTVKRTVSFGKGIRAVVAREEKIMPTKKKTTRRPAAKRTSTKRKTTAKPRSAPKRRTASRSKPRSKPRSKKTSVVTARRRPYRASEPRRVAAKTHRPKKRPKRRVRETPVLAAARSRKPAVRSSSTSYVMSRRPRPRHASKVRAWFGDSAGHSKAAKKGWKTRKGGKSTKATKKAAEAHRSPKRSYTREALTVQTRRRPKKRAAPVQTRKRPKKHRVRETMTVQARRRPTRKYTRESMTVQTRRRPKKHRARETRQVRSPRRTYARAPSFSSIGRTALAMSLELGTGVAGYLLADGIDRFLAAYDPSAANKPNNKFTSDGAGTLANALNVASAPDLWRYGSLGALTLFPLGGSIFIKHPVIRSSVEGVGIGAGIKLFSKFWSSVLMPMLIGKDTSVPALQKSWIARLYPAEVSAALNMRSGTAAVSSGGAASKAGTLSDGPEVGVGRGDAGPFALGHRFDRGERQRRALGYERDNREWVAPPSFPPVYQAPVFVDPDDDDVVDPVAAELAATGPTWPTHWGERHRWGLRGVGDAVQDMTHTIVAKTGVHPAHAVNAAMHVAAEPHDITVALERALPHLRRELLRECARHVHPHVVRMHAHARHPREHAEWVAARSAEGLPAPDHNAPEHEWREWHGKRAAAGLPQAPPPPEPPAPVPSTPTHLRERHEWQPNYAREIAYDRYPSVQQVLGIGAGGPASSGYPGQPGLGEAFSDAVQTVAASVPMPLENAVNATAYAAAEPFNCQRAIERAMPLIRRELARYCADQVTPYIRQLHEQAGIPLSPPSAPSAPAAPTVPSTSALPVVVEFVPSPPPPSWGRGEAEWHEQERRDWEHAHSGAAHPAAVVAAATHAAEAAAAPHPDANKPAVQAAVKAVADKAAQAASSAPPGTPAAEVHAAATQAAQAGAANHPAVADHPAVQAASKAAASAATAAADHPAAVSAAAKTGTSGVGNPPRNIPVGPPQLPHPGPQPMQTDCGCLDDSPFLGFVGDEVEQDLLFNLN